VCGGDISGPSNVSAVDEHRVRRIFEVPVLVAALLVIPVIAIEESDVTQTWKVAAEVTNWLIWIAVATLGTRAPATTRLTAGAAFCA
jgi:hypothetical protein